jgi:hypothetical protein
MQLKTKQHIKQINKTNRITVCSNNQCKYANKCLRTKKTHINELSEYYEFDYKKDSCFRKRNNYEGKVREFLRF